MHKAQSEDAINRPKRAISLTWFPGPSPGQGANFALAQERYYRYRRVWDRDATGSGGFTADLPGLQPLLTLPPLPEGLSSGRAVPYTRLLIVGHQEVQTLVQQAVGVL